jgi:hypothetical protein
VAELKSIQEAHANAALHSSQVMEPDDAEADLLREKLRGREDEIEAIRKELTEFKRSAVPDNAETIHNEGLSSRAMTPEPALYVSAMVPR